MIKQAIFIESPEFWAGKRTLGKLDRVIDRIVAKAKKNFRLGLEAVHASQTADNPIDEILAVTNLKNISDRISKQNQYSKTLRDALNLRSKSLLKDPSRKALLEFNDYWQRNGKDTIDLETWRKLTTKTAERSVNSLYRLPLERVKRYLQHIHRAEEKMTPEAKVMIFQTFMGGPQSPRLARLKQKLRIIEAQKANLKKVEQLKTPFNINPYLDYV